MLKCESTGIFGYEYGPSCLWLEIFEIYEVKFFRFKLFDIRKTIGLEEDGKTGWSDIGKHKKKISDDKWKEYKILAGYKTYSSTFA